MERMVYVVIRDERIIGSVFSYVSVQNVYSDINAANAFVMDLVQSECGLDKWDICEYSGSTDQCSRIVMNKCNCEGRLISFLSFYVQPSYFLE